jgi:hypothetical protein
MNNCKENSFHQNTTGFISTDDLANFPNKWPTGDMSECSGDLETETTIHFVSPGEAYDVIGFFGNC